MKPIPRPPGQGQSAAPTTAGIAVRPRPDLVFVHTRHKHESAIVVKDPIAMKYHRLRPDEWFVLKRLRRGSTLRSLQAQYEQRFRPQKVTLAELNDLLFRFHRLGLTLSDQAYQGDRLLEKLKTDRKRRWVQHLSGILLIRFPGVDPEPILKRLYPIVRPLLGTTGLALMLGLAIASLLVLASNGTRFLSEFPSMRQWIRVDSVMVLAAVLGLTKIFHELGHAVVCKHFGAECHQIGPMLLVFTPALYCDTSDSWTLSNRYARAAVGLAGIGTEIALASAATLVWAITGPSLVHYVAMNVMVVCSVSTLLFNANPLLRYDGYYVLSDLCDTPNLGQHSNAQLACISKRLLLGIESDDHDQPLGRSERFWLVTYALAALAYRIVLTCLILWIILRSFQAYRLESVGRLLCLLAAGGFFISMLRHALSFLRHPGRRRLIRMPALLRTGALLTLLIVAACLPLPSGETAPGRLVPRQETPIYVSTPGHLDTLVATEGMLVQKGDPIVELDNPEVVSQFSAAQSRVFAQRELVRVLESGSLTISDAANELPAARAMLVELERQLSTRRERRDALTLRSAATGRLIAAPRRHSSQDESELTLTNWSGDPTERGNRGCFVETGTELFSVVTDDTWDAELIVTAMQLERIKVGNTVKLVLESDPSQTLSGVVSEISSKQWTALENRQRRDDEHFGKSESPQETSYAVRVKLDPNKDETQTAFLFASDVSARISAEPISVLGRSIRSLSRVLRFR